MEMLNKDLRRRILEKGLEHKHGHYGSSMSCVDAVKYLYDNILKEDDIFIMSKGHGAPALHAVLEKKGLPVRWTIHLEFDNKNGIHATTGSLGLGLSIALGRAFGKMLKKEKGRVFCLVGDGELQEGVIWETINIASRFKVYNLIILVDYNKYQAISSVKDVMNEDNKTIKEKLKAFGCNVYNLNGHDYKNLKYLLELPQNKLNAYILNTQKGRGIPFLEKNPSFHVLYMHEHPEIYKEVMENLK